MLVEQINANKLRNHVPGQSQTAVQLAEQRSGCLSRNNFFLPDVSLLFMYQQQNCIFYIFN
ncbi:unnamed protein product, partial [Amoebophrya sp. A120]|eukprot:GSA120T00026329001.1